MNPKVTVVVPSFNVGPYIGKCLDSILNQTLKDIEVILVDDGSPDKCPEIVDEYAKKEGQALNSVQEVLAYELTKMVHGEEEAKHAQEGARKLFAAGGADTEHLEAVKLDPASFRDSKIDLIGALVAAKLVTNRSEGRRAIEQGGVTVDEEKVTDVHAVLDDEKLKKDGIVLRRGKKKFAKVAL